MRQNHQRNAQPRYWFNEIRNPRIDIWLCVFPAYVLPHLVALVFIWSKPHRRFLQRLNRNPAYLGPEVLQGVRNDQTGDFPRQLQGLLALFHVFCTGRAISQGTGFYKDDLLGYGCAEALSLLVGGFYLDTGMLASYLATSCGWMLLTTDTKFFAAAALLSLPCAWQIMGRTGLYHWQSGILLLLLALDYAGLEIVQQAHEFFTTRYIKSRSLAIYLPCLLVGGTLNLLRTAARTGQGDLRNTVRAILTDLYDTSAGVLQILKGLLAFLLPVAINAAITGFLGACIGWRSILFGTPANSPFSSPIAPMAWIFIYLALWCLVQVFTESRHRRRRQNLVTIFNEEFTISADVTGLAAMIMALLWWIALSILYLRITI